MSRLDRRTLLKTAAASAALAAPGTAQRMRSKSDDAGRRAQAMGAGGFSPARLSRMHDVMAGYVDRGEVPGIVTLVSRRGEVHVDAIGMKAVGGKDPIQRDTI